MSESVRRYSTSPTNGKGGKRQREIFGTGMQTPVLKSTPQLSFASLKKEAASPASKMPRTDTSFKRIRIKNEEELFELSQSGSSEEELSPRSNSSASPRSNVTHKQNNLVNFGSGVYFRGSSSHTMTPASRKQNRENFQRPGQPRQPYFCFNCKRYGHVRRFCRNPWYSWWPTDYIRRHPWLRRKVMDFRKLQQSGRMEEYKRAMQELDAQVENAEMQETQHEGERQWTPNFRGSTRSGTRSAGQQILHAIRRCSPKSPSTNPFATLCDQKHPQFNFDCQNIIDNLQQQVDQLRLTLLHLKNNSSPPHISSNNSVRFPNRDVKTHGFNQNNGGLGTLKPT